jgi:hypothetical protein
VVAFRLTLMSDTSADVAMLLRDVIAPAGHGVSSARDRQESMKLDHRIRQAETRLFARGGLQPEESFLDLASAGVLP